MSTLQNTDGTQVPGLEYSPRQNGDVVDNSVMSEIVRRLRFAGAPGGDLAGTVNIGTGGARVSNASGNQIQDKAGIYIPLGAGLSVLPGNGLELNDSNQIALTGKRAFSTRFSVSANGTQTFTLPESMSKYAAIATYLNSPGTARVYLSSKSAEVAVFTVENYSTAFSLEVYAIELT